LRDTGAFAAAAEAYAAALALSPSRTDVKVQLANMLKDSGQFDRAEEVYQDALGDDPGNADIHLQLGHLQKMRGRRSVALASYRRALELDPLNAAASLELASAGETGAQLAAFDQQMRHGGVETLLTIRARLDEIARQIGEIRATLPDAQASVAFPAEAYAELRRMFDCPPAPTAGADLAVVIVLLADREPLEGLYAQISSVCAQVHGLWSLRVAGADPDRQAIVERAAARDSRIGWVPLADDETPAAAEVRVATGTGADWVLLPAPGARLHRHALSWIAAVAARTGAHGVVMDGEIGEPGDPGDELRLSTRMIVDQDSILEANVYGETVAVAAATLRNLGEKIADAGSLEEARTRLLMALIDRHRVAHIPLPLVRVPSGTPAEPQRQAAAQAAAVKAHLGADSAVSLTPDPSSAGGLRVLRPPRSPDAAITVIIPTKNNEGDLHDLVQSLLSLADRRSALDIRILNNGRPKAESAVLAKLASLPCVSVTEIVEPFNWSRFNNLAAAASQARLLVFANDDMRMLSQDWDQVVRSFLEREDVGALGARLLYPDDTVQHAGILFDWRGSTIHDGLYRPVEEAGPASRWRLTRAVSAVTGAFLATRRTDFDAVGGFDETDLPVSYSDVDYALKLRALGRRIVWTPMVTLYHHESKTRGLDHLEAARAARSAAERRILEARWPGVMSIEPSLDPFWRQASLPHRLLAMPSLERIWAYIERGASANPWLIDRPSPAEI
jgi:GT2 family glycosyltransferase/tetratricopeptide (TPR) repeat protein